jgi:hypothetical protein
MDAIGDRLLQPARRNPKDAIDEDHQHCNDECRFTGQILSIFLFNLSIGHSAKRRTRILPVPHGSPPYDAGSSVVTVAIELFNKLQLHAVRLTRRITESSFTVRTVPRIPPLVVTRSPDLCDPASPATFLLPLVGDDHQKYSATKTVPAEQAAQAF